MSVDSEWDRRILEEKKLCFSQFVSAYHAFTLLISSNNSRNHDDIDFEQEKALFAQFQIHFSNAVLICEQSSIRPLAECFHHVNVLYAERENPDIDSAFATAMNVMRKELTILQKQRKAGTIQGAK